MMLSDDVIAESNENNTVQIEKEHDRQNTESKNQ